MNHSLTKPYIFYHSHCQDGIVATGVMLNYFETNKRYTRPCIVAYNHGDAIDVKALKISRGYTRRASSEEERSTWINIEVYFLDILPSLEILKAVADSGCKIMILDHHKSAIKIIKDIFDERVDLSVQDVDMTTGKTVETSIKVPKYSNIVNGFDLEYSGCGLAWKYAKAQCEKRTAAPPRLRHATTAQSTVAQSSRWGALLAPQSLTRPSSGDSQDSKGSRESQDSKGSRDSQDSKGSREAQEEQAPQTPTLFCADYNPLVEFVQDRDIWRHSYKESNWVLSYLATTKRAVNPNIYAREVRLWGDMSGELTPIHSVDGSRTLYVNPFVVECIEQGRKVFEAYLEACVKIAEDHVVKTLRHPTRDYRVAITECSGKYASAVGDILSKIPGVDFSVSYENVTELNGGNTQCRGIVMNLGNEDPYIYLRARARNADDVDLSEIIRCWDAEGSTGGGHAKAAGSTSTMRKFTSSFC